MKKYEDKKTPSFEELKAKAVKDFQGLSSQGHSRTTGDMATQQPVQTHCYVVRTSFNQ